jgi:hypothetical protein
MESEKKGRSVDEAYDQKTTIDTEPSKEKKLKATPQTVEDVPQKEKEEEIEFEDLGLEIEFFSLRKVNFTTSYEKLLQTCEDKNWILERDRCSKTSEGTAIIAFINDRIANEALQHLEQTENKKQDYSVVEETPRDSARWFNSSFTNHLPDIVLQNLEQLREYTKAIKIQKTKHKDIVQIFWESKEKMGLYIEQRYIIFMDCHIQLVYPPVYESEAFEVKLLRPLQQLKGSININKWAGNLYMHKKTKDHLQYLGKYRRSDAIVLVLSGTQAEKDKISKLIHSNFETQIKKAIANKDVAKKEIAKTATVTSMETSEEIKEEEKSNPLFEMIPFNFKVAKEQMEKRKAKRAKKENEKGKDEEKGKEKEKKEIDTQKEGNANPPLGQT